MSHYFCSQIAGDRVTFEIASVPENRVRSWVERVTEGTESCLDFGAGIFTYIKAAKSKRRAGIEAFEPYCQAALEDPACLDINIYHGDMRKFQLLTFDEFEVALFIDSLEHLSKADALTLLRLCQDRFKRIAAFVPVGNHVNPISDNNELQLHLSTWESKDLENLGFSVIVDAGFHHTNPPDKRAAMFAVWNRSQEWPSQPHP